MIQIRMKDVIEQELKPIMVNLFLRMVEHGHELVIDGMAAYDDNEYNVGGKVMDMGSYIALELIKTEESFEQLRNLVSMVSQRPLRTWGILNGLSGVYRLKQAGLLETFLDGESLKKTLDWRTFVDVENHYALIEKPPNFYSAAFGIARYRELLGWDSQEHRVKLLDRLLEHIDQYSEPLCYMDDTPGDGRFDRYSFLLPAEVSSVLLKTGGEVPEKLRIMLGNSARIFLQLANEDGWGFSYGRSLGAYGDTAALEVLSCAARLDGILTAKERDLAYDYCIKLTKHVVEYWYDQDMQSFNLWEKGRRTDKYRAKKTILSVNLALCMQVITCYEHWVHAGYENRELSADYSGKLKALAPYTVVKFTEGGPDRGLVIVRDGTHVWSLPLINGGKDGYYKRDAYLPVPFQNCVLQAVPMYCRGNLVPQLVMENGDIYMPIAWIKTIESESSDGRLSVRYMTDTLCRLGDKRPERAEGTWGQVSYTFEHHRIHREDVFYVDEAHRVMEVRLIFLTFSDGPVMQPGNSQVLFEQGEIKSMTVTGYDICQVSEALEDGSFDTPCGRLRYGVYWMGRPNPKNGEFRVSWTLTYQ